MWSFSTFFFYSRKTTMNHIDAEFVLLFFWYAFAEFWHYCFALNVVGSIKNGWKHTDPIHINDRIDQLFSQCYIDKNETLGCIFGTYFMWNRTSTHTSSAHIGVHTQPHCLKANVPIWLIFNSSAFSSALWNFY